MPNSSGASTYAPHPTIAGLYVGLTDSTSSGGTVPITFCIFRNVSPDTTANVYHHGCIAQVVTESSGSLSVYVNTGTSAAPSWTNLGALPPGDIALAQGKMLRGSATGVAESQTYYGEVAVLANGTTAVPLFGTSTPFRGSLTSVEVISLDDLNGTITLSNSGVTVTTIVKGSANTVRGSATFVNNAFLFGGSVNIVNSTAAGAVVKATFVTGQ